MEQKFFPGDEVVGVCEDSATFEVIGTIVEYYEYSFYPYTVKFDGLGTEPYYWHMRESELVLVNGIFLP